MKEGPYIPVFSWFGGFEDALDGDLLVGHEQSQGEMGLVRPQLNKVAHLELNVVGKGKAIWIDIEKFRL